MENSSQVKCEAKKASELEEISMAFGGNLSVTYNLVNDLRYLSGKLSFIKNELPEEVSNTKSNNQEIAPMIETLRYQINEQTYLNNKLKFLIEHLSNVI